MHFSATLVDSIFASVFTWTSFLYPLLYLEICSSFDLRLTQETQDDFILNSLTNYIFKALIADKDIFKDSRDWRVELSLGEWGQPQFNTLQFFSLPEGYYFRKKKLLMGDNLWLITNYGEKYFQKLVQHQNRFPVVAGQVSPLQRLQYHLSSSRQEACVIRNDPLSNVCMYTQHFWV